MRKFTLILVVALMATVYSNGIIPLHSIETPSMVVSNETAEAGDNVIIDVSLVNNPGIISAKIIVEYDRSKLTLNSTTDTGLSEKLL